MGRLPETGSSLSRYLRRSARAAQRQAQTNAFEILPPGIVGNDALASPMVPSVANVTATNFAITTTWAEVVGADLLVPDDCTRLLLVNATARVYAVNNSAGADDLSVRVSLDLVDGQAFLMPLAVAAYGTVSSGLATLAEGLTPGTTLRLKVSTKTTTSEFTADPANTTALTAGLLWLR